MSKGVFVVGTGTDVGKTYVTGLILKRLFREGMKAGYYKAAMSGNERDASGKLIPGDALNVRNMSGIKQELDTMCPYVYEKAVSPHLASRLEGNPVELDIVKDGFEKLAKVYDFVTVEGSGGILCPICIDEHEIWLEDIIRETNLPCVLIADAGLGTINQVVLTVKYMHMKNLKVKGIIFNHYHKGDVMEEDNIKMCEYMTGLSVIGTVADDSDEINIDTEKLIGIYEDIT